jgi:hypothetical protein
MPHSSQPIILGQVQCLGGTAIHVSMRFTLDDLIGEGHPLTAEGDIVVEVPHADLPGELELLGSERPASPTVSLLVAAEQP